MATAAAVLSCAAATRQAEPVRTVFRIFSGTDEVTAATRVRVRVSGTTEEEGGIVLNGPALAAELAPGIYDAQAIHHRRGRVLNVRWAERLVIVRYPDEGEEHLEVINFLPNFGALQLRLPPRTRADPAMVTIEDGAGADRARVYPGSDYLLVVAPAGTYTFTVSLPTGPATLPPVEIPADRTRMRVLGGAETP
jgi:hypothetical protein